jgi:hypothetical protein
VLRGQVRLLHDQHDDQNGGGQRYCNVGGEFLHRTGGGVLGTLSLLLSSTGRVGTFTSGIVLTRDGSGISLDSQLSKVDKRQVFLKTGGLGRSSVLYTVDWCVCADRKFAVVGTWDGSLHLLAVTPNPRNAKPTLGHSWFP